MGIFGDFLGIFVSIYPNFQLWVDKYYMKFVYFIMMMY